MRCYERVSELIAAKTANSKEEWTFFKFLNACEYQIKDIFVSGIKGIKTVKTSKRVIMTPDAKEKISKKKKDQF
jgi:hypothetical protein